MLCFMCRAEHDGVGGVLGLVSAGAAASGRGHDCLPSNTHEAACGADMNNHVDRSGTCWDTEALSDD